MFQITTRALFVNLILIALCIAGMFTGGLALLATNLVFGVTTIAMTVVATVGRGSRRAYAIGFVLPIVLYWFALLNTDSNEFELSMGRLATSKLISMGYESLVTREWELTELRPAAAFQISIRT